MGSPMQERKFLSKRQMERDTTRRSGAKSVIPKEWKATDGIKALPAVIRARVLEAVTRFRLGDSPEDSFFSKRMGTESKMAIASELVMAHVGREDIARLLGITRRGLEYMLARLRERNAAGLPLTWNRDRLIETVDALEDAGYMSMSLAEAEPDNKVKAVLLANAIRAYSDAGKLRLKLGVSAEVTKLFLEGMRAADNEAPDPNDRIDLIEWVYRNKIAKRIEPSEDADTIDESKPKLL